MATTARKRARTRRAFGMIRKLPSGRWQANYTGPDLAIHKAPRTFDAKMDAEAWLAGQRRAIDLGTWTPPGTVQETAPAARAGTFAEYASTWLADRDLKDRTRELYESLLARRILPTFGEVPLDAITAAQVRRWHAAQGKGTPTARSHAYGLLRTILATAVADELLAANPCHIRGAGSTRRVKEIRPASVPELQALTEAMPPRYRAMTLLAAWCSLRFGELAELRRSDVDLAHGVLRIRRAVATMSDGTRVVGVPKSAAGARNVAVPPHLLPVLTEHLAEHAQPGRDGLLFPAADGRSHLATSTLYKAFQQARDAAGRPDLRFHDLRHSGAVLAAQAGATLADLMSRLGHSSPAAALVYQHSAADRDTMLAARLSEMAANAG